MVQTSLLAVRTRYKSNSPATRTMSELYTASRAKQKKCFCFFAGDRGTEDNKEEPDQGDSGRTNDASLPLTISLNDNGVGFFQSPFTHHKVVLCSF